MDAGRAPAALAQRVLESVIAGLEPVGRSHVVRLPCCYPVPTRYQRVLQPLQTHLDSFERLSSIGRGGSLTTLRTLQSARSGIATVHGATRQAPVLPSAVIVPPAPRTVSSSSSVRPCFARRWRKERNDSPNRSAAPSSLLRPASEAASRYRRARRRPGGAPG